MKVEDERRIFEAELYKLSPSAQAAAKKFLAEVDKMKNILVKIQDLPHEIWRDVVGYEGLYQVSNMGRFKSLHFGKSVILNPSTAGDGYKNVTLSRNGEKKYCRLHKLVAEALIPNPENKPEVNHIDGNKLNNRADNLQWVTYSENTRHAYETGLAKKGCEHHSAKFMPEKIVEIRETYIPYDPEFGAAALSRENDVNINTIQKIVHGISYTEVDGTIHDFEIGHEKLSLEDKRWICEHYIKGDSEFGSRPLGRKFGVDPTTISRTVKNKDKYLT